MSNKLVLDVLMSYCVREVKLGGGGFLQEYLSTDNGSRYSNLRNKLFGISKNGPKMVHSKFWIYSLLDYSQLASVIPLKITLLWEIASTWLQFTYQS